MSVEPAARVSETQLEARSYELDAFGHVNHAVYLNYFEHARFQALETHGFPVSELRRRNEGVHVVRVEVDYRAEAMLGQAVTVRTEVEEIRHSSLTLRQQAHDPERPELVFASARVVAVWIGPDRRPMRVPDDVRRALGPALERPSPSHRSEAP